MAWGSKDKKIKNRLGVTTYKAVKNWDGSRSIQTTGLFSTGKTVARVSTNAFGNKVVHSPGGRKRQVPRPDHLSNAASVARNLDRNRGGRDGRSQGSRGANANRPRGGGSYSSSQTSAYSPPPYKPLTYEEAQKRKEAERVRKELEEQRREASRERSAKVGEFLRRGDREGLRQFQEEERKARALAAGRPYTPPRDRAARNRQDSKVGAVVAVLALAAIVAFVLWVIYSTAPLPGVHFVRGGSYGYYEPGQ